MKLGLNLGCGSRPITTYEDITFINVDCEEVYRIYTDKANAEFVLHDLTQLPLPFSDGSSYFINISQCLEHFHLLDAINILTDCYRILKPLGKIRVSVPDAKLILNKYLAGQMDDFASVQPKAYSQIKSQMTKFGLILFGALHAHGEHGHCQCYDDEGLEEIMRLAGFANMRICEHDKILDADIAENHQLALSGEKPLLHISNKH